MFQVLLVLLQYFEDRYASFYVQNPITDFTELLERVKKVVPVLKGIPDNQIRISYKDVQLGTSVNIDLHEQLQLQETFQNAFPCGSDSYRRVHLKVRESDSPFLLKSSQSSQPLPQIPPHFGVANLRSFHPGFPRAAVPFCRNFERILETV